MTRTSTTANKPIRLVTITDLADWLGITGRRAQQLVDDGIVVKSGRGSYDLKASVQGYINELRREKKTSGLQARQEESLAIRNHRDQIDALKEYGTVVQKDAVVHELVPIIKVLQSGLRALPNTTARENMAICKEYAEALQNGTAQDQQVTASFRDRDLKIVDNLLQTMADTIGERYGVKVV